MEETLSRLIRKSDFLNQQAMAKHLGIEETGFCKIVRGKRKPTPEQAKKIAKALDRTVEELFGR
jgi:DNA-binding XRE family transcriptional regulator